MIRLLHLAIYLTILASQFSEGAFASDVIWTELMKAGQEAENSSDLDKAEKLLSAALKDAESDRDEPRQAQSLLWLARVYERQDKYPLAETILRKALLKVEKVSTIIDPAIHEAIKNELMIVLHQQNKEVDATEFRLTAAEKEWQAKEALAKKDPYQRGKLFFEARNFVKAEPVLERVFKGFTSEAQMRSPEANACLDMLYQIYRDAKQYDKAEKLLESALDVAKSETGDVFNNNFTAGRIFLYLAGLFSIQQRDVEAGVMAKKGFTILFNPRRYDSASAFANLVNNWEAEGKKQEAQALEVFFNQSTTERIQPKPKHRALNLDWQEDQPTSPK